MLGGKPDHERENIEKEHFQGTRNLCFVSRYSSYQLLEGDLWQPICGSDQRDYAIDFRVHDVTSSTLNSLAFEAARKMCLNEVYFLCWRQHTVSSSTMSCERYTQCCLNN